MIQAIFEITAILSFIAVFAILVMFLVQGYCFAVFVVSANYVKKKSRLLDRNVDPLLISRIYAILVEILIQAMLIGDFSLFLRFS